MIDCVAILRHYNRWRRGADIPQADPKEIGKAIDEAIEEIEHLRSIVAAGKKDRKS